MIRCISILIFTLFYTNAVCQDVQNPYFKKRNWRLWLKNQKPVTGSTNSGIISLLPVSPKKRLFPDDSDDKNIFLKFRKKDWPQRKYAGFWDMLYSSHDNYHTRLRTSWSSTINKNNKISFGNSVRIINKGKMKPFGIGMTSQSTTGMGHDIVNSFYKSYVTEKEFYFSNVFRSAPAHISYLDTIVARSDDKFEGMLPYFYDSVGSSGSETHGLAKMVIASGYLNEKVSKSLKENGLFPSVLFYLWKKTLPWDVPYHNELRHRVAYYSKGDHSDYNGGNQVDVHHFSHAYDEILHMKNLVNAAKSLEHAPPIPIISTLSVKNGDMIYGLKNAVLIHQIKDKETSIIVSMENSFDIQGFPITHKWKVLYGNKKAKVTQHAPLIYEITIPYDENLPKGRTTIIVTANNGYSDSNPAAITIYKKEGNQNLRPTLELTDKKVFPGEKLQFNIISRDPEGYPVTFYKWQNDVGVLNGNQFTWQCPKDQKEGIKTLTIIASDGCTGASYTAKQIKLKVTTVKTAFSANILSGSAPLKVVFNNTSTSKQEKGLKYKWDFNDGKTSSEKNPTHTFTKPGFYEVKLTGKTGKLEDSESIIIHVKHNWKTALDNGFEHKKIDENIWQTVGEKIAKTIGGHRGKDVQLVLSGKGRLKVHFGLETKKDFTYPLYLETEFRTRIPVAGTGIQILDAFIGSPKASGHRALGRHYIAHQVFNKKAKKLVWKSKMIKDSLRFQKGNISLKVFVDKDPNNKGKIRFSGYISDDISSAFFQYDNIEPKLKKLGIITGEGRNYLGVPRFKVWSPGGKVDIKPELLITRNGYRVHINGPLPLKKKTGADFGVVSTETKHKFTIHNNSNLPLLIPQKDGFIMTGNDKADFKLSENLPTEIAAGKKISFSITFNPKTIGMKSATLQIKSNDTLRSLYKFSISGELAKEATINVHRKGTFVQSTAKIKAKLMAIKEKKIKLKKGEKPLVISPIILKGTTINLPTAYKFRISNIGDKELTLKTAILEKSKKSNNFKVLSNFQSIPANSFKNLIIGFSSAEVGLFRAELILKNNDKSNANFSFDVAVIAREKGKFSKPMISAKSTLKFDKTIVGHFTKKTFKIFNNSNSDLNIKSVTLSGNNKTFSLVKELPDVILKNTYCELIYVFTPHSVGSFTESVIIESDAETASFKLNLQAESYHKTDLEILSIHGLQLSTLSEQILNVNSFGSIGVNESGTLKFMIHNNGSQTVKLTEKSLQLKGEYAKEFKLVNWISGDLKPGEERAFDITLVAKNLGLKKVQVHLNTDVKDLTRQIDIFASISEYNQNAPIKLGHMFNSTIKVGDFNKDGENDVMIAGQGHWAFRSYTYFGQGGLKLKNDRKQIRTAKTTNATISIEDFDKDGLPDVLITAINSGNGTPYTGFYQKKEKEYINVKNKMANLKNGTNTLTDFDGDKKLDALICGMPLSGEKPLLFIYKYIGKAEKGKGSVFEDQKTNIPGYLNSAISCADFDNDGDQDILITGKINGVAETAIYENLGKFQFKKHKLNIPGITNGKIKFINFDKKGQLDIFICGQNKEGEKISAIYANNEKYNFADTAQRLPGVTKPAFAFADYDKDGDFDLILAGNAKDKQIFKLFKNNNGKLVEVYTGFKGFERGDLAWEDIDGDGDLEIISTGLQGSSTIRNIIYECTITKNVK